MKPQMNERQVRAISGRNDSSEKRNLHYFEGVSKSTAGSSKLAMQRLVIPAGAKATPHSHDGYETAIYILKGKVETRFGDQLEHSIISEAGDYVFIPPYVPHQPINLSATEEAEAIIARSIADEMEPTIPYLPG